MAKLSTRRPKVESKSAGDILIYDHLKIKRFEWFLPILTKSEANVHEHWSHKSKRAVQQKKVIWAKWNQWKPEFNLPCKVILTRCAMKILDDDNLMIAFKAIRDQLADLIIPGLAKGQADGDARIKWEYEQEKSKIHGIKIQLLSN